MYYIAIKFYRAFLCSLTTALLIPFLAEMKLSYAFPSSAGLHAARRSVLKRHFQMSSLTGIDLHQQTLSVAPMMAHTNRHFRTFWRLISKRSVLYTEMVVAEQIVNAHSKNYLQPLNRHLGHNPEVENPLVLQLGGNDPELLGKASAIAYSSGFQSINLNCGCPSNTVASTNSMGASMMYTPELTAECCAAIINAGRNYLVTNHQNLESKILSPDVNFSVKCRTGVDDLDSYEDLHNFVQIVSSQGGVKRFQIHARKALLGRSENQSYSDAFLYRICRFSSFLCFFLSFFLSFYLSFFLSLYLSKDPFSVSLFICFMLHIQDKLELSLSYFYV